MLKSRKSYLTLLPTHSFYSYKTEYFRTHMQTSRGVLVISQFPHAFYINNDNPYKLRILPVHVKTFTLV